MTVKLYLHYQGDPQYSKVFKLAENTTCTPCDLLASFVNALNLRSKPRQAYKASDFRLESISGKPVEPDTALRPTQLTENDFNVVASKRNGGYAS